MKIGLPRELTHMDWARQLKLCMDELAPGLEWVEAVPPGRTGNLLISGDACYPFKKMVSTAVSLSAVVDVLFIPRLVGRDEYLMCPNFRALPDMVRLNIERGFGGAPIPVVSVLVEDGSASNLRMAARESIRRLEKYGRLQGDGRPKGNRAGSDNGGSAGKPAVFDPDRTVALVGHPYVLADPDLNGSIPEILESSGYGTITPSGFRFDRLDALAARRDYFAKKVYWRSAREIVGAFIHLLETVHPAGIIQVVPFNCGIDALLRIELMDIYRREQDPPPFMAVVCDEHTQRDHIVTRIEAFLDIIDGIKIN